MKELAWTVEFWVAMAIACIIKLRASPPVTRLGAAMTVICGVGCALVFTKPLLAWMSLDFDTFGIAASALVALTGENFARQIVGLRVQDFIAAWRKK